MTMRRVMVKLSGEVLAGEGVESEFPHHLPTVRRICEELAVAHREGVQIAIVVGGGNIFRGAKGEMAGMDRNVADQFGMLATIQNGIVLKDMLQRCEVETRLMTGLRCDAVAEPYIYGRALRHFEKKRVVVFVGGTGSPYFTTDTAAALRAAEISATLLAKATKTDYLYDKDPEKHADAVKIPRADYDRCLSERLNVLDAAAFDICRGKEIPIRVFKLLERGNLTKVLLGEDIGSLVTKTA